MCDLLGLSFNNPINARISLDVFQRRGKENPDGWGVAYYHENSLQIVKEPEPATNSTLFDFVENSTNSKTFLCHVRRTTMGIRSYLNTHPFYRKVQIDDVRREWVFAHNGTLKTKDKLQLRTFVPLGETDSEQAFCYILDWIQANRISTWDNRWFSSLQDLLHDINDRINTFNCLLSDGVRLFCYSDENRHNDGLRFIKRSSPFGTTELIRNEERLGSVKIRISDNREIPQTNGYLIVTEELTTEDWVEFANGELIVFDNGQIIYPSHRKS